MKQVPLIPLVSLVKITLVVTTLFCMASTCYGQQKPAGQAQGREKAAATKQAAPEALSYQVFASGKNGFGYDILYNNKPLVHQPSIPGLPGNKGFIDKKDAEKVAGLVISKIKKNQVPPTVTRQELDSLHIK